MQITILTLFPEMFSGPFSASIIKRAQEAGHVAIRLVNIRDFGQGNHNTVDDTAYGGGIGMVMRVDVLHDAIEHSRLPEKTERVVLLSASGSRFTQTTARSYAALDHLILICGHYEGIDERILDFIDEEVSLGDFVVTGGEIPAMLITDAVTRLLPGVLKPGATALESFSLSDTEGTGSYLVEYPQYTKPAVYRDKAVPEVLRSGDHKRIETWRMQAAKEKTKRNRPDLLQQPDDTSERIR
jgi:tRNA (guanine37-N1)-methyltransferase